MRAEQAKLATLIQEAREQLITPEAVRARFDDIASPQYGANMAQWVPDYDEVHALLLDALVLHVPADARLLDLGAGTGRVSELLLGCVPQAHVTLVDFSANMLAQAPARLTAYSGRYTTQVSNFFADDMDFPAASFHGIVSVFALCHGRSLPEYQQIYARIYHWLQPGGFFICYDHVLGATDAFTLLNVTGWYHFMAQRAGEAVVEEGIRSTYDEDLPLSLPQHIALLQAAGFSDVDVLYKRDIFGLYAGRKPA